MGDWVTGVACTLSVPNIYGERRDLGPGPPFTEPSFACWDRPPLTLESGYRVLLVRTWHRDSIGCTYLTT